MRQEYIEACAQDQIWRRRWIVVRDHSNLGLTVIAYIVASVGKRLAGIWKMIP